jgi:hypothetical protein
MFSKLIATAVATLVLGLGTAVAAETPQGLKADGLRLQAMAQRYQELHGYTPAALYADGQRWQAMARAYATAPAAVATGGEGFNWGDAGIGAAGGFVAFLLAGGALVFVRRSRRTKLAL